MYRTNTLPYSQIFAHTLLSSHMFYIEFEWDEGNEEKISKRASLEEVESVFYDRKRKTRRTSFNRYVVLGRTSSGRYLFIVY